MSLWHDPRWKRISQWDCHLPEGQVPDAESSRPHQGSWFADRQGRVSVTTHPSQSLFSVALDSGWCLLKLASLFQVKDTFFTLCFQREADTERMLRITIRIPCWRAHKMRIDLKPFTVIIYWALERHTHKSAEKNSESWCLAACQQNAQITSPAVTLSRIKPQPSQVSLTLPEYQGDLWLYLY